MNYEIILKQIVVVVVLPWQIWYDQNTNGFQWYRMRFNTWPAIVVNRD